MTYVLQQSFYIVSHEAPIKILKMGKTLSLWTKFDPLTTATLSTFEFTIFSSFDKIKFVKHQCDLSHTQNQRVTWFPQQFQFITKKLETFDKI